MLQNVSCQLEGIGIRSVAIQESEVGDLIPRYDMLYNVAE